MLAETLNTNQVKNAAGTEVEMTRISSSGRSVTYAQVGEPPARPYRLTISHNEIGDGIAKRRRSVIRFDKDVESDVDSTKTVTVSAYMVADLPIGGLETNAEFGNVIANLLSFCSTTGAATTVLFDCTGNGANAILTGSL